MEGGHENARDLAAMLAQQGLEGFQIVPREPVDVRVVFLDQPAVAGGAPGVAAVVGAVSQEDFFAPGVLAGDLERPGGHVRAVLAEDRPGREIDEGNEAFGEVHHDGRRVVEAIAQGALAVDGGFDLGVAHAEDVRAVAAEEVEEFVAVGVPVAAALGAGGVVGRGHRQGGSGVRVAGDAAGDHAGGALEERQGAGVGTGHAPGGYAGRGVLSRGGCRLGRRGRNFNAEDAESGTRNAEMRKEGRGSAGASTIAHNPRPRVFPFVRRRARGRL